MTPLSTLLNHPKLPKEIRDEILAEMVKAKMTKALNYKYESLYQGLVIAWCYWGHERFDQDYFFGILDNCIALGI